jgi:hypothetical protein
VAREGGVDLRREWGLARQRCARGPRGVPQRCTPLKGEGEGLAGPRLCQFGVPADDTNALLSLAGTGSKRLNEVLMDWMNGTPQGVGDDLLETAPSFGRPFAAPKRLRQDEASCYRGQVGRARGSSLLNDCFSVRCMAATDADPTVEVF